MFTVAVHAGHCVKNNILGPVHIFSVAVHAGHCVQHNILGPIHMYCSRTYFLS